MPDAGSNAWPDAFDWFAILAVAVVIGGLPIVGYAFMLLDFRTYLRSLKRAMVVVRGYALSVPDWVRRDTPPCFAALGLRAPCTEQEVLAAYRERVKEAHPDRGGSRNDFDRLQRHFELAMALVTDADHSPSQGDA